MLTMQNIELKPCPFCGANVELIDTGLGSSYQYLIRHPRFQNNGCIFDDGKTVYATTPDVAAETWNRRSDDAKH